MNEIAQNILDPSWWFSGVFFALISVGLAKMSPVFLKLIRNNLRSCVAKRQRKIKNARFNQNLIFYHIVKANAFFVIFIIFLVDFLAFQNFVLYKKSLFFALINFLPVIFLEVVWLTSDGFAKDLIKENNNLRKLRS
jgi:hypothetical protein